MKKSDTERDVLTLAGEMVREFFVKNDFSSFANHLSKDAATVLNNGIVIVGKENIANVMEKSVFFSCKIEREENTVKNVADDIYATSFTLGLTSSDFAGIREVRADLVFKADAEGIFSVIFADFATLSENSRQVNFFPLEKKLPRRDRAIAREELLINFLLEGLGNKEIAKRLALAEITIKKALSKIYQRYGVKNRGELLKILEKK